MLGLTGSVLFCNKSRIDIRFLPLLGDLEEIVTFSWGRLLYCELSYATPATNKQIVSPLVLLQVYALHRVSCTCFGSCCNDICCLNCLQTWVCESIMWADLIDWSCGEVVAQEAQTCLLILWHAGGITTLAGLEPVTHVNFYRDELDKMSYNYLVWLPFMWMLYNKVSCCKRHTVPQLRTCQVVSMCPRHATV